MDTQRLHTELKDQIEELHQVRTLSVCVVKGCDCVMV